VPATEKLRGYAAAATSAGLSAGAATLKSRSVLVDAVGRLVKAAVDRVLLSDDRVTSAADGKRRLAGQTETEPVQLADRPAFPSSFADTPPTAESDWLRGRRGPAADAYRRLRRLFPR